jgi:hypothetical protein
MAKLNYDKLKQQRMDRRKSVCIDTFKKTKSTHIKALWDSAINTESKFLTGKYAHKDIGTIIMADASYCLWVIDNQPSSVTAKQILRHYNK